jgi:hypothetical protein
VWKQLNAEHQQLFPTRRLSSPREEEITPEAEPVCPAGVIREVLEAPPVLVFGQRPSELQTRMRRRSRDTVVEQGLLFS